MDKVPSNGWQGKRAASEEASSDRSDKISRIRSGSNVHTDIPGKRYAFTILHGGLRGKTDQEILAQIPVPEFDEVTMRLLAYQPEYTREGIPHIQGYVEFYDDTVLGKDVRHLPGFEGYFSWIEPAWRSRDNNVRYCTKLRTKDGRLTRVGGESGWSRVFGRV